MWRHPLLLGQESIQAPLQETSAEDPVQLKRIYADNYKCLLNFELRLREITQLVGQSGAGKTAVSDVVYA